MHEKEGETLILFHAIMLTAFAGYCIHILSKRARKKMEARSEAFLKREMEANTTRKKEIEPELFFTPDTSGLPFREYAENEKSLTRRQNNVKKYASKKMLRFKQPYNNTELKLRYGIANLENIIQYESNANAYIYALIEWSQALLDSPYHDDAETILQESIRLGSDYSKSYLLLISFYKEKKDYESIRVLRNIIDNQYVFGDNITKMKIVSTIDNALDEEAIT